MNTIGIVGGVGPRAGLDLVEKIFDNTAATHDQAHLDVVLVNSPRRIADRTDYLLAVRHSQHVGDPMTDPHNPAHGIIACIQRLVAAGANVLGVPCNTAHAPLIFDVVERAVAAQFPGVQILHLVRETVTALSACLPQGGTVGLLATPGTYASGVYRTYLEAPELAGLYRLLEPDEAGQGRIHDVIYAPGYGIKATSAPVSLQAVETLTNETWRLYARGADAVIMGCTEIPLALDCRAFPFPLVDPATLFARALIRAVDPTRLRLPPSRTGLTPYALPELPVTLLVQAA